MNFEKKEACIKNAETGRQITIESQKNNISATSWDVALMILLTFNLILPAEKLQTGNKDGF